MLLLWWHCGAGHWLYCCMCWSCAVVIYWQKIIYQVLIGPASRCCQRYVRLRNTPTKYSSLETRQEAFVTARRERRLVLWYFVLRLLVRAYDSTAVPCAPMVRATE